MPFRRAQRESFHALRLQVRHERRDGIEDEWYLTPDEIDDGRTAALVRPMVEQESCAHVQELVSEVSGAALPRRTHRKFCRLVLRCSEQLFQRVCRERR